MITVWFLMALMSYPDLPAIAYRGYGGFLTQEECEEKRISVENDIAAIEVKRKNTVYIETYCMEMEAFESQLKEKDKKLKGTSLGV